MQSVVPAAGRVVPLPEPETLPEAGKWYVVNESPSTPTAANGDYHAYPHLQGGWNWREALRSSVERVDEFFMRRNIYLVCPIPGCNMQGAFTDHITSTKGYHFKNLCYAYSRSCRFPENVVIEELKELAWEQQNVPTGAVRYNHITWEVRMMKGQPPENCFFMQPASWDTCPPPPPPPVGQLPRTAAAAQRPAEAPSVHDPPPSCTSPSGHTLGGHTLGGVTLPNFATLPEDDRWFEIVPAASCPMTSSGSYTDYPHWACKAQWKDCMQRSASMVSSLLGRFRIYPTDCHCEANVNDFKDHLLGEAHFKALRRRLDSGKYFDHWKQWRIPQQRGLVAFNHVDGTVLIARQSALDALPPSLQQFSQSHAGPAAQPQLQSVQPQLALPSPLQPPGPPVQPYTAPVGQPPAPPPAQQQPGAPPYGAAPPYGGAPQYGGAPPQGNAPCGNAPPYGHAPPYGPPQQQLLVPQTAAQLGPPPQGQGHSFDPWACPPPEPVPPDFELQRAMQGAPLPGPAVAPQVSRPTPQPMAPMAPGGAPAPPPAQQHLALPPQEDIYREAAAAVLPHPPLPPPQPPHHPPPPDTGRMPSTAAPSSAPLGNPPSTRALAYAGPPPPPSQPPLNHQAAVPAAPPSPAPPSWHWMRTPPATTPVPPNPVSPWPSSPNCTGPPPPPAPQLQRSSPWDVAPPPPPGPLPPSSAGLRPPSSVGAPPSGLLPPGSAPLPPAGAPPLMQSLPPSGRLAQEPAQPDPAAPSMHIPPQEEPAAEPTPDLEVVRPDVDAARVPSPPVAPSPMPEQEGGVLCDPFGTKIRQAARDQELPSFYAQPGDVMEVLLEGRWRSVRLMKRLSNHRGERLWEVEHIVGQPLVVPLQEVWPSQGRHVARRFEPGQAALCNLAPASEQPRLEPVILHERKRFSDGRKAWSVQLQSTGQRIMAPLEWLSPQC